ncbi:hypothetical protein CYLTODRAFT_368537 [Cylindrobasidium torrendii FP15055 ss-10]|uniref:RNA polymerase Rpb4/RPC9 core domain-containing protein n=1 Tax=Cylindrobasidium torrendii FP15055 ss-10 TaxID=1314674 RepID=A0A0D7BNW5_9AGAR|nr:hypothetical protein CYLTODRAFT_368537 [Cylindrobasidium torrendii FP15055 ss-10]
MAHRARGNIAEEEDAATLKLGPDFQNAGCLLISEVKYLLENKDREPPDTAVYTKTLEYVKTFAKFSSTDSAGAVREILRREAQLSQFEIAQIANLCPATSEEAKSIIPSLVKVDDDRLQALLDEIQIMRKFQS